MADPKEVKSPVVLFAGDDSPNTGKTAADYYAEIFADRATVQVEVEEVITDLTVVGDTPVKAASRAAHPSHRRPGGGSKP